MWKGLVMVPRQRNAVARDVSGPLTASKRMRGHCVASTHNLKAVTFVALCASPESVGSAL